MSSSSNFKGDFQNRRLQTMRLATLLKLWQVSILLFRPSPLSGISAAELLGTTATIRLWGWLDYILRAWHPSPSEVYFRYMHDGT